MPNSEIKQHLGYNTAVNILDGSFFGGALGVASTVTVLPLFLSTLTNSAVLIGLINAVHVVGWQLPQLLTARHVARLRRYKPMVLLMSTNERLPYIGLALVAWFAQSLGRDLALILTFLLLIWQGLGGGFAATAWQSMIGKIMPAERRGTFFGLQSAGSSLFGSGGAIIAGLLLKHLTSPLDYTLCFGLAFVLMLISWLFLAQTREPATEPEFIPATRRDFWQQVGIILRRDVNFRWFLLVRIISQFGLMAIAFFTVYAVKRFAMNEQTAGILTALYLIIQMLANPLMGWLGDRLGHQVMLELGMLVALIAALGACLAPALGWFYLIFACAGVAQVAASTTPIALTLVFGTPAERPVYIGLANTLVAPATLIAPLLGGWIADAWGYPMMFAVASVGAGMAWLMIRLFMHNPQATQMIETASVIVS